MAGCWMSKVKQSPETCPNRPFEVTGNDETAVLEIVLELGTIDRHYRPKHS